MGFPMNWSPSPIAAYVCVCVCPSKTCRFHILVEALPCLFICMVVTNFFPLLLDGRLLSLCARRLINRQCNAGSYVLEPRIAEAVRHQKEALVLLFLFQFPGSAEAVNLASVRLLA